MNWPQYAILGVLIASVALGVAKEIWDTKKSSTLATVGIFIHVGYNVGIAAILHAGGFW